MISTPTRPADNVVITTKGLQDRNIHIIDGTTVENKGKLTLTKRLRPGLIHYDHLINADIIPALSIHLNIPGAVYLQCFTSI